MIDLRRFLIWGKARLAELVPWRTSIRARHPELVSEALSLAQIIAIENVPYENPVRGAHVGKIDATMVQTIALLIQAQVDKTGLPVWYLAACLDRESRFDPNAYNENLSALRHTPTFEGTDWGIAQLSGRWNKIPGLTNDQVKAKLLDPAYAVPDFAHKMAGNVAWAQAMLAGPTGAEIMRLIGQVASNPIYATAKYIALYLATYAYNSGNDGALADLRGPRKRVGHPNSVMSTAIELEQEMGVPV